MTRPGLLLLDLDGTLVDSFADIRLGIAHAFAAIGLAAEPAWLELSRRGVALEVFYRQAFGRDPETAADRARLDRFVTAYRDFYLDHQDNTRPYDGVVDTLAWLRRHRPALRIAVATAKRSPMAEAVVTRCGLGHLVDLVQGSEGMARKPDPAVLERAAARLGQPLATAVMVGDTDGDILAARSAGCRAVAVTYGGFRRVELDPLRPDHIIDHFGELRDLV